MKKLFGSRFHRIPVILIVSLLVLILSTGAVLAAYPFFEGKIQAQVEEAIVLGMWDTWDNLVPYGNLGGVDITLGTDPTIAITTIPGYAGAGFVAGESIVIPINFRNAGEGELTLGATVDGDTALILEYCWLVNDGDLTETGNEGQQLARDFKDNGDWAPLGEWAGLIVGNGGKSGSAIIGAQVLFVRVRAPGDIAPGPYTLNVAFNRS